MGALNRRSEELTDVHVEWIAPEERDHPADEFRVAKESGAIYLATRKEVETFADSLQALLDMTKDTTNGKR
jgi:hypothetical protein